MGLNKKSDQEVIQIATPMMDNLIEGSTQRDWAKHTKHFTKESKAQLTEKELLRQCEAYQASHGNFADREFVGITRHPDYVNVLWKQRMTKSRGEYLAILTLVEVCGEYQVIRCWVDLWEPKK